MASRYCCVPQIQYNTLLDNCVVIHEEIIGLHELFHKSVVMCQATTEVCWHTVQWMAHGLPITDYLPNRQPQKPSEVASSHQP